MNKNSIWLIVLPSRWTGALPASDELVEYERGWFATEAEALAKVAKLNNVHELAYQEYLNHCQLANAQSKAVYTRQMGDYEALRAAGRRARKPKQWVPSTPMTREAFIRGRRGVYETVEVTAHIGTEDE